jgi:hypothetical protein
MEKTTLRDTPYSSALLRQRRWLGALSLACHRAWILIALPGLWVGYRGIRGWMALSGVRPIIG